MFAPIDNELRYLLAPHFSSDSDAVLRKEDVALRDGSKLLPDLVGWLCPASEVAVYAQFGDVPRIAVVAPNDWMRLRREALARRVHYKDRRLVPLRDESGVLIGRVGLARNSIPGAVVLHGVRCGGMSGLIGVALARENNRDARRTEASIAGSTAAWSRWAEQVLDGQPNLEIELLLKLHPLLRDHDLPVWYYGREDMTLDDLVARIVSTDELRVHLGEVSHEDDDDMSSHRFDSGFDLSNDLVIMPKFGAADVGWNTDAHFPWFLGVAPTNESGPSMSSARP